MEHPFEKLDLALLAVFGDPLRGDAWLNTAHPASLGGATPIQAIRDGRLTDVLGLLEFLLLGA